MATHADQFVHVSDLVDNFVRVRNYGVEFLERLQRFIIVAESFVYKTQVVNSFDAVSFDTNGFEEEFFGAVVVLVYKEAISLVNEGL